MQTQFPSRTVSRRGGLTLLELVMVVSILAILTALIVPGMGDQQEETRRTVARATLQELRDVIANRYMQDMSYLVDPANTGAVALPQPHRTSPVDTNRVATANMQVDGSAAGIVPQLHFLFVNPNQYAATATPQYVAVSDYDANVKVGWNGPYVNAKATTYPNPNDVRFPKDPNNSTKKWSDYGFTTMFGQVGDYCVNDPWGSPYVVYILPIRGGANYSAYLVSAGPNRGLDFAVTPWSFNSDGTLNSGDDLALMIKQW